MSGALKGIGKVFKKVVKTLKKVALPLLAIGAVVLTGGAALGVIAPLGAGGAGILGGLSPVLTGIIGAAGKGAMFGAVGALATGGNVLKGMTTGAVLGGVTGGIGSALGGGAATAASAAGNIAGGGTGGFQTPADKFVSAGVTPQTMAGTGSFDQTMTSIAPEMASRSAMEMGATPAPAIGIGSSNIPQQQSGFSAPAVSQVASTTSAPAPSGGGMLGWFNKMNPTVQGTLIQGIGGALTAGANAKDARKERQAMEESYSDTSGLFKLPEGFGNAYGAERYDAAIYGGKVKYDRRTGQVTGR